MKAPPLQYNQNRSAVPSLKSMMVLRLLVHHIILLVQLITAVEAFTLRRSSVYVTNTIATTKLNSSPMGDLFSGIIGVAPSSLNPPIDVLEGTSIDPTRDDVDLGRVYKVSR